MGALVGGGFFAALQVAVVSWVCPCAALQVLLNIALGGDVWAVLSKRWLSCHVRRFPVLAVAASGAF